MDSQPKVTHNEYIESIVDQQEQGHQHESEPFPPSPKPQVTIIRTPSSTTNSETMMVNLHDDDKSSDNKRYMPLLLLNYFCLFVGSFSASLLSKYYFNHKGSSRWVSTWVQSAGFPLLIIPIYLPYLLNLTKRKPFTDLTLKLFLLSLFVGTMLGLNNLLFSWGNSYLPVSTSSLLLSSQLVFNLILSAIIVKQKITFSNLNCVILLTISSLLLAIDSSNQMPPGITNKMYFVGFFCTVGAGLLFALYLPIMEKIFRKVYCYEMVMEMQLIMEVAATLLALVGMASDHGFSEMKRESEGVFDKGKSVYWLTVLGNVVTWQLCFMGTAGMVFLTSSITSGICMTALLAINVIGGVVFFKDRFDGIKAISTGLCIWGFCSYVYGLYVNLKKKKREEECNGDEEEAEMINI